jgi:hypothetical protein
MKCSQVFRNSCIKKRHTRISAGTSRRCIPPLHPAATSRREITAHPHSANGRRRRPCAPHPGGRQWPCSFLVSRSLSESRSLFRARPRRQARTSVYRARSLSLSGPVRLHCPGPAGAQNSSRRCPLPLGPAAESHAMKGGLNWDSRRMSRQPCVYRDIRMVIYVW